MKEERITAKAARRLADNSPFLINKTLERIHAAADEGLTMVCVYIGDEHSEDNLSKTIGSLQYLGFTTTLTHVDADEDADPDCLEIRW